MYNLKLIHKYQHEILTGQVSSFGRWPAAPRFPRDSRGRKKSIKIRKRAEATEARMMRNVGKINKTKGKAEKKLKLRPFPT